MDLRSGRVLWPDLSNGGPPPARRLARHESCDVLVVGSGMTGAIVAWYLVEAGLDVVVVDQRPIATGSTPASTALLQYDLDTTLTDLAGIYGMTKAAAAYRRTRAALDELPALLQKLDIDCDLARRPSLYLAAEARDVPRLRAEAKARQAAGLEATFLDEAALLRRFNIARPAAIHSPLALEIDPWKFCTQMWSRCIASSVRVYSGTGVTEQRWGRQPLVHTSTGYAIDTTHVVFATGYEAAEMFAELNPLVTLKSTFALATTPVSSLWPERALIWETADPYCYARTTLDHRIIIGGGDLPGAGAHTRERTIREKTKELLGKLSSLFPHLPPVTVDRTWAGAFAETEDGLPYIGSPDFCDRCHFALGYGGNGMTLGVVAAEIIRDAILARPNAVAPLFSFDRVPMNPSSADRKVG